MFEFQQIKVKAPDRDKIKYVPFFYTSRATFCTLVKVKDPKIKQLYSKFSKYFVIIIGVLGLSKNK
jgi:hypothetical protein